LQVFLLDVFNSGRFLKRSTIGLCFICSIHLYASTTTKPNMIVY